MNKKLRFSDDFIKKAARLLKGETLDDEYCDRYKLHKPVRKKYNRSTISVNGKNDQWSIDLADMKHLARFNKNYRYILVCVDVYTRYAHVSLLKKKSANNTASKLENIFIRNDVVPKKIQCDEGTEFQKIRGSLSKEYHFTTFSTLNREIKASHAERFIRTLKEMIQRVLTVMQTNNYASILQIIVDKYNDAPHSALFGRTPRELYIGGKHLNKRKILKRELNKNSKPVLDILKEGDKVRFSKLKGVFDKSSLPGWTSEVFRINKVYLTNPVTYTTTALNGEEIRGKFYREELQKV